jgi:tetratricopeptide (TPR) repeat protein
MLLVEDHGRWCPSSSLSRKKNKNQNKKRTEVEMEMMMDKMQWVDVDTDSDSDTSSVTSSDSDSETDSEASDDDDDDDDDDANGSKNAMYTASTPTHEESTPEEQQAARSCFLAAVLNRAECFLRLKAFKEAIADCEQALAIDGIASASCVKAHFRMGCGYMGVYAAKSGSDSSLDDGFEELEAAKKAFAAARKIDPANKAAAKKLQLARAHLKRRAAKNKKAWGGIAGAL